MNFRYKKTRFGAPQLGPRLPPRKKKRGKLSIPGSIRGKGLQRNKGREYDPRIVNRNDTSVKPSMLPAAILIAIIFLGLRRR